MQGGQVSGLRPSGLPGHDGRDHHGRMPDVYRSVTELDPAVAEKLADAMELRATEPQQQAMLSDYLADLALPDRARVLEIGCGTGAISRVLATRPEAAVVVGVDPSEVFLRRARQLAEGLPNLTFERADGADVPMPDGSVDAVILHTVLSHVPDPAAVLAEAHRLVRPGGRLAAFEGDYATTTVALGPTDPLQACADAFIDSYVNDCWVVRRLPALLSEVGFSDVRLRSHGYVQTSDPIYLLSIVDRGADALAAAHLARDDLVEALKTEARHRVDTGRFFGHIAYASATATRPT